MLFGRTPILLIVFTIVILGHDNALANHAPAVIGGEHLFPSHQYINQNERPAGLNSDIIRAVTGSQEVKTDFYLDNGGTGLKHYAPWLIISLFVVVIILLVLAVRFWRIITKLKGWTQAQLQRALQAEQRAERLQNFDSMTSLPRRKLFEDYLYSAIHNAYESDRLVGVSFIHITDYNKIKQIAGFSSASKIIQAVAKKLITHANESVYVSHFGNGEFGLIADNIQSGETIYNKIYKIVSDAEIRVDMNDFPIDINLSCGLAFYPDHGEDPESVTRCAELASGFSHIKRGSLVLYDSSMEPDPRQMVLMPALRDAIREDILGWVFQPILGLKNQKIVAVEMLARWNHPLYGPIAPDLFIPKAEESGVIIELTRHVIQKAGVFCREWEKRNIKITISINVSGNDLSDPTLINAIMEHFSDMGNRLILEVAETAITKDIESIIENVNKLKAAGIQIALDKYGIGHSSLFHVRRLQPDKLKIDRHFIKTLCDSEEDEKIVNTIIHLGHELEAEVIAEGVENLQTLEKLKNMDCDAVQGYGVAMPMPAYEFVRFYEENREKPE